MDSTSCSKSKWSWYSTESRYSGHKAIANWAENLPSGYDSHSHGESPINGGFNGKNIYFYGPFSRAMLNNQRVNKNGVYPKTLKGE